VLVGLTAALGACGEPGAGTSGGPGPSGGAAATPAGPGVSASSGASAATTGTPATAAAGSGSPAASTSAAGSGTPAAGAGRCPEGMVLVPGGTFRMGSPADDKDADADERPVREVTLRPYCAGRTEVTVSEYEKCVSEARGGVTCSPASTTVVSFGLKPDDVLFWSKFCNAGRKDAGSHPINCVDWRQATTYCTWAGGRLPTEAEWEHAARGADGRKYPWGNEPPSAERLNACGGECAANAAALGRGDKKTMYSGDDGAEATAPVGRYPAGASPFGLLDMAGNVWEWTADVHAPYDPSRLDNPVAQPPAAGAPGAGPPPARVVRGGHWLNAGDKSPPRREPRGPRRGEEARGRGVPLRGRPGPVTETVPRGRGGRRGSESRTSAGANAGSRGGRGWLRRSGSAGTPFVPSRSWAGGRRGHRP
jgi:sulfatase modifying factor 1